MSTPDISTLDYIQLNELRQQISTRMKEMRETGISDLRSRFLKDAAPLGLAVEDIVGTHKKKERKPAVKYKDEEGNTWGGRGKRPGWITEALEAGRNLEEFLV